MTQLKFTCPSCGQHIQCGSECANRNVPCPACASLVRVPADAGITDENPFQPAEESKVSYPGAPRKEARVSSPQNSNGNNSNNNSAAGPSELHCVCPVCQSELRISLSAKPNTTRPAAGDRLAASSAFGSNPQATDQLSLAEREKKIAAAREAHPVTPYPVIKPRLDKILSKESAKLEFVPPQLPNSAEEYKPEIDPDQILRSHNSE